MNSIAVAGNFPVVALRRGGVEQPRIPDERHGDDAAVAQAHADGVVGELDFQHALVREFHHPTRLFPATKSKWRSRLSSGSECCRQSAAIQMSLVGIAPGLHSPRHHRAHHPQLRRNRSRIKAQRQTGTGKSHLAQAIGHAAIQQGYRVLYRETHALLDDLAEATLDGTRKEHMEFLVTVPLLILDDLGMRKLPLTAAEELLEIIMRRYERASTMLTSNRPVEDWGKLLGDAAAVSAMLDRLLHHGHVLKCGPRSWRTKTDLPPQEAVG